MHRDRTGKILMTLEESKNTNVMDIMFGPLSERMKNKKEKTDELDENKEGQIESFDEMEKWIKEKFKIKDLNDLDVRRICMNDPCIEPYTHSFIDIPLGGIVIREINLCDKHALIFKKFDDSIDPSVFDDIVVV